MLDTSDVRTNVHLSVGSHKIEVASDDDSYSAIRSVFVKLAERSGIEVNYVSEENAAYALNEGGESRGYELHEEAAQPRTTDNSFQIWGYANSPDGMSPQRNLELLKEISQELLFKFTQLGLTIRLTMAN